MKKLSILSIPIFLVAYSCSPSLDAEKEMEAIKALVQHEKEAYFERDAEKSGKPWIHDEHSRKIFFSPDGVNYLNGWEAVDLDYQESASAEMWDQVENLDVEFSDYEFNFYDNTAMVFCTSTWTGKYRGEEVNLVQNRILHLVRINGNWKFDLMAIYRVPE
jgi:hypothetical protein